MFGLVEHVHTVSASANLKQQIIPKDVQWPYTYCDSKRRCTNSGNTPKESASSTLRMELDQMELKAKTEAPLDWVNPLVIVTKKKKGD